MTLQVLLSSQATNVVIEQKSSRKSGPSFDLRASPVMGYNEQGTVISWICRDLNILGMMERISAKKS